VSQTKWLRGDPDRPFPTDLDALNEMKARYVRPTHEPIWFYRNRGSATPAEKHRAVAYKSDENIDLMARMGLHMPQRAQFFKGFGLQRERPFIDETIRYARKLHERGMLVSVYVGGTVFTDYFFKEVPEAVEWCRVDQNGLPITYGGYQLERWFPCLNHPDYRAYLHRVLDVAVQEVEADEIFFDNQILRHEPRSCRCERCVRHFREMIRKRYTLEQCEERYGLAEYPDSVPPIFSQACKPWRMDGIRTTQIQDWIDHRIATVVEFYADMAGHVKAQKPDIAVGLNIKGIHGHNRAFAHGICHGALSDLLDFSCIDGYRVGMSNGSVQSEIRFYKSSHSSHISVVDGKGAELQAAESQVFGYRKEIPGHGWLCDMGNCTVFTPMAQFLRGNQRLFHQREHIHDVAVLRSAPSTNYNCAKVHEQLMAFEKTLAVEKLPWGIIFDKQIDDLARRRIVALPEIQALSDEWLDALDAFLRAGGGVIASGDAARYNGWYRGRDPEHALSRWLGRPPGREYEAVDVGAGRFVYVPTWDVEIEWDMSDWFEIPLSNDHPVRNRGTFLRAIEDAAGGRPLTFRVSGPEHVFVEAIAAADGVDLHYVNYDRDHLDASLATRVALPAGKRSARVILTDPHDPGHRQWDVPVKVLGDVAEFEMFTPMVYGLAQVTFS